MTNEPITVAEPAPEEPQADVAGRIVWVEVAPLAPVEGEEGFEP